MGSPAFDDDDTAPAPCGCAACLKRYRSLEVVASAGVTRVTSIHAPRAGQWTVYLLRADQEVVGTGTSEEEAFDSALLSIGVVR